MRRWSLALIFSFATPALAQAPAAPTTPEAAAAAPAQEPPAAPATPAPEPVAPTPEATTPEAPTPEAPTPAAPKPRTRSRTPAAPTPAPALPPAPTPAAPTPASPPAPQPDELKIRPETLPPANVPLLSREERIHKDIQADARFLFQSLITGDVRSASMELFYPFQLEDKRYATPEELVVAWVKQLRLKRTDLITLYDIEVLPLAEMEKKYGKPPARLGLDLRNEKDLWAAVGNLSGRPGIFLFRPYRDEYRAFAYTD